MGNYLIQGYLDESWRADPDKAALVDDKSSLSYDEVQGDANRIAHCLKANGVERQDRVVIFMKRSPRVVVALLGVLKADAIYVPLDGKSPVERLRKVLADCQPSAIVCDEATLPLVEQDLSLVPGLRMLLISGGGGDSKTGTGIGSSDGISGSLGSGNSGNSGCGGNASGGSRTSVPKVCWSELCYFSRQTPRYRNIDADPAYILYTSGSTGTPKGVVVSHLNVINYIEWAVEYFEIHREDRILGTAPFHFDMSTFDIFTALKAGGTLCVTPERHLLFPRQLLDLIEQHGITLWKGVSSLLMYLSVAGCLKPERIPSLERVLFGGEVLAPKHLRTWMQLYPAKRFYNVYGPTEATGISACYRVDKVPGSKEETIPIGRACANTEILVLGEDDRLAAPGEMGELCIRGSGLSLGYWRDQDKTSAAFVPNPVGCSRHDRIYRTGDLARLRPDGLLEYLGRKDFQVKVMGYRIELYEIESAILSLDRVYQAAVLLCDSCAGVPELVAFVAGSEQVDPEMVTRELGTRVPAYMLPSRIVPLAQIPLNDRGKIDRNRLRDWYTQGLQATAPEV